MKNIKNISVIGTGVIGTGWILRFLACNKKVTAFDKNKKQIEYLKKEIARTETVIQKLYKRKINLKNNQEGIQNRSIEDNDYIITYNISNPPLKKEKII